MSLIPLPQLENALAALPGWQLREDGKAIIRAFKFKNFREAFVFMTRVAEAAEAQNHHPDWTNIYNRVSITLNTHEAGGVTEKDIALARAINNLAS